MAIDGTYVSSNGDVEITLGTDAQGAIRGSLFFQGQTNPLAGWVIPGVASPAFCFAAPLWALGGTLAYSGIVAPGGVLSVAASKSNGVDQPVAYPDTFTLIAAAQTPTKSGAGAAR